MKAKIVLILTGALLASALVGCGSSTESTNTQAETTVSESEVSQTETSSSETEISQTETSSSESDQTDESTESADSTAVTPIISETGLEVGTVTVYDYGNIKLHAYATGDALGDEAFIVESEDSLVGIELPSFTDSLDSWKAYTDSLGKPMNDIFVDAHATGASYVEGLNIYGTQAAKDAISSGSTYATTQGLADTFGDDFHGGDDMVQINQVVSDKITVAGIDFNVIDAGDDYDLEICALNVVYTHMLGKTSHSILASTDAMDAMLDTLHSYQNAGYDMILSGHSTPEGQDAVTEKIFYVETAKELASECSTAEEFISAMQDAFPDYIGESYLQMTAGFLYPEN